MPQNVDENICESNPKEHVKLLAEKKLNNLDKIYPNSLIISADTIVYFNNKIYYFILTKFLYNCKIKPRKRGKFYEFEVSRKFAKSA